MEITAPGRNMIGGVRNLVGNRVDQAMREAQIAMVGQHHRLVHHFADPGDVGCIQLRNVQVDHIGPAHQFPGDGGHGRHDQPLANAHQRGHTHHRHAVNAFQPRQVAIILRCENGHRMAAPGKRPRHPFSIDGQAGGCAGGSR